MVHVTFVDCLREREEEVIIWWDMIWYNDMIQGKLLLYSKKKSWELPARSQVLSPVGPFLLLFSSLLHPILFFIILIKVQIRSQMKYTYTKIVHIFLFQINEILKYNINITVIGWCTKSDFVPILKVVKKI